MDSSLNTAPLDVIGIMSGTSLDGIDLAACRFEHDGYRYRYTLLGSRIIPYTEEWVKRLSDVYTAPAREVFATSAALGELFGSLVNEFNRDCGLQPNLIASHGHTVFHEPAKGFTIQIGSGAHIAALTGIDTICDFRSKDVALKGQGAPLVPVGDHLLFSEYTACLNLGGIANISLIQNERRVAWDICPVNMALNELALRTGRAYDEGGQLAASGTILPDVLERMNALSFYSGKGPKSLGREWYEQQFRPLLEQGQPADLARTVCEHIALQHAHVLALLPADADVLVTGGGAYNRFLIEKMAETGKRKLSIPGEGLVNFKEAIVFAFLGALNYWGRVNVFDSATGSVKQHIGGAVYRGL